MPVLRRSTAAVIAVEVAALAAWWRPVLAPAGVILVVVAAGRWRGRWLSDWVAIRWGRARNWLPSAVPVMVDEEDGDGNRVAVTRDAGGHAAILALAPAAMLEDGAPVEPPWQVLADALRADPVRPAAVQLVVGQTGHWWASLRVDPVRSAAAVRARGGGAAGADRAVRAAALRLAVALTEAGFLARPLAADEARAVLARHAEVPRGTYYALRRSSPQWTSVTLFAGRNGAVWYRTLSRAGGTGPGHGALRLDGQQEQAHWAAAPLAVIGPDRSPAHPLRAGAAPTPSGPPVPGELPLGYDADGHLRRARLHRPVPTRIVLVGGVWAATLLARRATAEVSVVSSDPDRWPGLATGTPGSARPGYPQLTVYDGGPVPAGVAWSASLRVVPELNSRTLPAVHSADLVLAHLLTAAEAKLLCAELGLPAERAHWLANAPDDGLAVVRDGELTYLRLAPEDEETGLLGEPRR